MKKKTIDYIDSCNNGSMFLTKGIVGKGTFGTVIKVKHMIDEKVYAVKVLKVSDKNRKNIISEVKILSSIEHPNIIRYFGSWISTNLNGLFVNIQMDYCEYSLKNILEKKTKQKIYEDYFRNIISGIKHLHELNIIHRDLKPSNILINDKDIAKISDLGLATKCDNFISLKDSYGSYLYKERNKPPSKSTDIFSLGIILVDMFGNFATEMERCIKIENIHIKKVYPEINNKSMLNLIKNMTGFNRITADKIYN